MIVIGAGASIGGSLYPKFSSFLESISDMPSAQNFFYELFRIKPTARSRKRYLNMLGATFGGVNDLIVRAFGLDNNVSAFDPDEWKGVNVEDVFTFLNVGERTYNPGTDYYKAFSKAQEFLENFIWLMLGMRSDNKYCEFLLELFTRLRNSDSVISFNWDTIADLSLAHSEAPHYKRYVRMLSGNPVSVRSLAMEGQYLKLHGSLNWQVCHNKSCRGHKYPFIAFSSSGELPRSTDPAFEACQLCGTKRPRRLIVPPVSNKLIQKGTILHKLWLVARERLITTSEIVFIGYSFPPTDYHTEWLFRQLRFLDTPRPRITVVNPDMYRLGSTTFQRYHSIFRGFKIRRFRSLKAYVSRRHA